VRGIQRRNENFLKHFTIPSRGESSSSGHRCLELSVCFHYNLEAMHDQIVPKLHKWPFFVGDLLLLALAFYICYQSQLPLRHWEIAACVLCVAVGATLGVLPFVVEYRATMRLAEAENLAGSLSQIQNIEKVAAQISSATNHWQLAQDAANNTTNSAKQIADGMAAELKGFKEFMERANESEKAALRLEVEKARRAETEWLQVITRTLDHVFALYCGATRSGQPNLIKQIESFQGACRDAARRVGLIPFVPEPAELFAEERHQLVEGDSKSAAGKPISETVATGYTFQGRLLRPAMVRLQNGKSAEDQNEETTPDSAQENLPLQSAT
jgi:molecular chaperone GrpE (heat shock protein)